ncbi:hypothetical protein BH11BAC4_BH11BAC4_06950 [soil metagenome]
MKIILLCDANQNQVALANKIADRFQLSGIVIETPASRNKNTPDLSQLFEKFLNKTIFIAQRRAWFGMLGYYKKTYPAFPKTETIFVNNINEDVTIAFINQIKPDLLLVSGTSLVKKKLLSLPIPFGIINLHTGLSPYIKGAPNCTNWCIAGNKLHLIGNTVMWIDAGIDSGDLLYTALTPLTGQESLLELHIKVMEHAHKMYLDAVQKIRDDFSNCSRVKQSSIAAGTVYFNKQWNWKAKLSLIKNFKKLPAYFTSEQYQADKAAVVTVDL